MTPLNTAIVHTNHARFTTRNLTKRNIFTIRNFARVKPTHIVRIAYSLIFGSPKMQKWVINYPCFSTFTEVDIPVDVLTKSILMTPFGHKRE